MLIAHNSWLKHGAGGIQRVHSGVDALGCQGTVQHRCGIEVRECCGGGWVGQVVSGNVDSLDRGDGAFNGGSNALLQRTDVGAECGLITHSRGHASEQSGHLGAGLHKAEDVVHEQQNVLLVHITEVLSHGQG
ncbi:MAG: Uncharacterised protein [Synechococcus sp. CC9902]|nr:MAG: Uncharacterised protein [Synechococcus sp. CC9902]